MSTSPTPATIDCTSTRSTRRPDLRIDRVLVQSMVAGVGEVADLATGCDECRTIGDVQHDSACLCLVRECGGECLDGDRIWEGQGGCGGDACVKRERER